MRKDFHGARKVLAEGFLEVVAPPRSARRQAVQREPNGGDVKSSIEAATTAKSNLFRIQLIKVVQDAAHCESFVVVQRMLKSAQRNSAAIEHQVLADQTIRIGQPIRELSIRGHQQ